MPETTLVADLDDKINCGSPRRPHEKTTEARFSLSKNIFSHPPHHPESTFFSSHIFVPLGCDTLCRTTQKLGTKGGPLCPHRGRANSGLQEHDYWLSLQRCREKITEQCPIAAQETCLFLSLLCLQGRKARRPLAVLADKVKAVHKGY